MENHLLENPKTHVTPELGVGSGPPSPAPERAPHGHTRATWEDGNKDSGRPPGGYYFLAPQRWVSSIGCGDGSLGRGRYG